MRLDLSKAHICPNHRFTPSGARVDFAEVPLLGDAEFVLWIDIWFPDQRPCR